MASIKVCLCLLLIEKLRFPLDEQGNWNIDVVDRVENAGGRFKNGESRFSTNLLGIGMDTSWLQRFFFHRITLNVLFWIGYFVYPFLYFRYTGEHTITVKEIIFYLIFYGSILYLNNLLLLPRYLKSRKFREYALIIIPIVVGAAFLESYVNKTLLKTCSCEGPNSVYAAYNFMHLGTIMLIFGAMQVFRDYSAKIRAYEKSENDRLDAELKFLRSQVNPHLLFNSLNSIYAYALEHSARVRDMVLKLSDILRYMLYECDKKRVPLDREVDYLKDYIALQQMRLEEEVVDLNVSGNFSGWQIAPMILINFLENAFKFRPDGDGGRIRLNLSVEDDKLHFVCENRFVHGETSSDPVNPDSNGLGLKNAKQLLAISYKDRYVLDIEDRDGIFKVDLSLELDR